MTDLIKSYINDNYRLTLGGLVSFMVIDKINEEKIGVKTMINHVQKTFSISDEEFEKIFNKWVDEESVKLQNKVVDYQMEIYNKTGIEIEVSPEIFKAFEKDNIEVINMVLDTKGDKKDLLSQVREFNSYEYED